MPKSLLLTLSVLAVGVALAQVNDIPAPLESVDGTGTESADGTGMDSADGTGMDSADGTGMDSADGTGMDSADGTGMDSADGTGMDSADGTGMDSADGTGMDSADGTGLDSADGTGRTYTVKAGDTLSGIAMRVYGDVSKMQAILDANSGIISDPNILKVGTVLVIPGGN